MAILRQTQLWNIGNTLVGKWMVITRKMNTTRSFPSSKNNLSKPMTNPLLIALIILCSCNNYKANKSTNELTNKSLNPSTNEHSEDMNYNSKTSLELMLLNNFAYDNIVQTSKNNNEIKEILEAEIAENEETKENELIWLGISENNNNLTYVVRKTSTDNNTLSIISRGSVISLVDVIEDVAVYNLVNWNEKVSPDIKISQGISIALATTMSLTSKVYGADNLGENELTLKELLNLEITKNQNTRLYVTGHSLGGALTTGISLAIAEEFYDYLQKAELSLSAYSFAGQTIGNDFFKDYYNTFLLNKSISFSYNRIINPFDIVPFAFNNLKEIENIGYPYSKIALLEIEAFFASINTVFSLGSKKYTHVGESPIELNATLPPPNCDTTVKNLKTFKCWVEYEHHASYYVDLLKAAVSKE